MKRSFHIKSFYFYIGLALAYFLLDTFHSLSTYPNQFSAVLRNNFWAILYTASIIYLFYEYSLSYILAKKRAIYYNILSAVLILFLYCLCFSYGSYLWRRLGIQLHIFTPLRNFKNIGQILSSQMAFNVGALFFFGIIRAVYKYFRLRQAAQQLRIEKQQAELNYLRSQTNPHFLFNTLNNIYALALSKSDIAPESILRLSKILRFMLYETGGKYIAIDQELKIINDYIALEKLRYDDSLSVRFHYDVEDLKQSIPPLLLIPLVENAFKHGVSETRNHPFVDIELAVDNGQLTFIVKNSAEAVADEPIVENIGLSNLRRQLELLYKEFQLSVRRNGPMFTATLKITLSSHV